MRRARIQRHPALYLVGLVELLVLHFVLCYPAAVCRGWPPLAPSWLVATVLVFPCVGLLPGFDDLGHAPRARRILLTTFCVACSLILGVAATNLADARPHTGHLVGYMGLIRDRWPHVLGQGTCCLLLVLPFVFCWDLIFRTLWNRVRWFDAPQPAPVRVVELLLIVASLGLLCGILRFIVGLDPQGFNRPISWSG